MANRQTSKSNKAGERVRTAEQDLGHAEMLRKSAEHDRQNLLDKNNKLQQQRDQYETQVEELRRTIGDHLETILKLTEEKESWVESVKDRDMQLESMVTQVNQMTQDRDEWKKKAEPGIDPYGP